MLKHLLLCLLTIGCSTSTTNDAAARPQARVAAPTITPNGGTFNAPVQVTLASATTGASIFYTTDGTTPSSSAIKYASPFTLGATAKVSALATKSGSRNSSVTAATFTIAPPPPPPPPPGPTDIWIEAYYPGYQLNIYPVAAIDWANLTHIAFASALPKTDGTLDTAFFIDATQGPIVAKQITDAARANGRKSIMMIGGASYSWASAMSSTNQAKFVQSIVNTASNLGFDGVDLDYEPPDTFDLPTFAKLVQALRTAAPSMLISVPVGWLNPNFQTVDPLWVTISQSVDKINIMNYGMADNWDGWLSWHSSALDGAKPNTPSSVAVSVNAYAAAGVPKTKLGVGAGFYGSCWSQGTSGPNQSPGTSHVTADDNTMSFTNIMSTYFNQANYQYDALAQAPYLSYATPTGPQKCNWISYEDATSLKAKGAYVKQQGLGAIIVWTINQGYLPNAPVGSQNPLMQALMQGVTQ